MFEDTLVVIGSEFGRTPLIQNSGLERVGNGRDHNVHVRDLQATILHPMGLDNTKPICRYSGRDYRLTDVDGHVVKPLLA